MLSGVKKNNKIVSVEPSQEYNPFLEQSKNNVYYNVYQRFLRYPTKRYVYLLLSLYEAYLDKKEYKLIGKLSPNLQSKILKLAKDIYYQYYLQPDFSNSSNLYAGNIFNARMTL